MRRLLSVVISILAAQNLATGAASAHEANACRSQLQGVINTPADDAVHCVVDPTSCSHGVCQCDPTALSPYDIEWWYWTGHLRSDDGRKFGFAEIIYSAIDLTSYLPLQWSDSTITDVAAGKYYYGGRETVEGLPPVIPNGFSFEFPKAKAAGGNGINTIHSTIVDQTSGKTYDVDLLLVSTKSPVQQRADGLVFYYSRERMAALGSIVYDDKRHFVSGNVWFDHQFGAQRDAYQNVQTWQWFALQLSDHRELVVYDVEVSAAETRPQYANGVIEGTYSDPNCGITHLTRNDFTITPLGMWQSAWVPQGWGDFQCIYPMGWRIQVPSQRIDVQVQPYFPEQEIIVPQIPGVLRVGDRYWEGDATVTGTDTGEAYVELTGFCPFAAGPY